MAQNVSAGFWVGEDGECCKVDAEPKCSQTEEAHIARTMSMEGFQSTPYCNSHQILHATQAWKNWPRRLIPSG
jgi:hypothetical protein